MNNPWKGLRENARTKLIQRDYSSKSFAERVRESGVEAGELASADRTKPDVEDIWIPGVEIFHRKIYPQRSRGFFGEFARQDDGVIAAIKLWPKQWATARMFANTAKGFHIHPPHIPEGEQAEKWFKRLYSEQPTDYNLRPYAEEQWDVMFFLQGIAEMFLVDERAGLDRRIMRFIVEGDDHRGVNNVGIIIPAGVAHAIRVESSSDLIMVYGTSTQFDPAFEGRIANDVESVALPAEWESYIMGTQG